MIKNVHFGAEARDLLLSGIRKLVKAVGSTLGPGGRTVVYGYPLSRATKDGVTVANELQFDNVVEQQGASLIRQAAGKTVSDVGDGTTTATVLAGAIIEACLSEGNINEVRRQLEDEANLVIAELDKATIPFEPHMIHQVAMIAGNNDEEVGRVVTEAYEKIGIGGVVTLKQGQAKTEVVYTNGIEFESGFITPNFITNGSKFVSELMGAAVLITTEEITTMRAVNNKAKGVLNVLLQLSEQQIPVLIIARDVNGEALGTLVKNKAQKVLTSCVVRAPRFGIQMRDMLEDLAAITGATVIDPEKGLGLNDITMAHLGKAMYVTVHKDKTVIEGGIGDTTERAEVLKGRGLETDDDKSRYAKLTGGVATIFVGGATDIERTELHDRYDDAYKAVRAAMKGGVVVGGGVTLARVGDRLGKKLGKGILYSVLSEPMKLIARNAGHVITDAQFAEIIAGNKDYDAKEGEFCNAVSRGIIDPVDVTKACVINAVSVAKVIIQTEVLLEPQVA